MRVTLALVAALVAVGCGGGTTSQGETAPNRTEDRRGGEKSVEEFGSEAGGEDRGSILAVFEGYLGALADEDPARACSYLAASVQRSLAQLAGGKGKGCARTLPKLLAPAAAAISREQANGKVTRVRVEGDQAFVVFHAPGARLYLLAMAREGGEWKSTTITASVLVPQL